MAGDGMGLMALAIILAMSGLVLVVPVLAWLALRRFCSSSRSKMIVGILCLLTGPLVTFFVVFDDIGFGMLDSLFAPTIRIEIDNSELKKLRVDFVFDETRKHQREIVLKITNQDVVEVSEHPITGENAYLVKFNFFNKDKTQIFPSHVERNHRLNKISYTFEFSETN